jgi:hypothetical protein
MIPAMTPNEIALLTALLQPVTNYVEFGSGGSTVLASQTVSGSVTSVDSSTEWLSSVETACRENKSKVSPRCFFVDIGPIGDWGGPTDRSTRDRWPSYHCAVWKDIPTSRDADLYLIDGRFRVACFLQSLLHAKRNALFAIHDFTSREEYHPIKQFTREVARANELSAFLRNDDFDYIECSKVLSKFEYNPP